MGRTISSGSFKNETGAVIPAVAFSQYLEATTADQSTTATTPATALTLAEMTYTSTPKKSTNFWEVTFMGTFENTGDENSKCGVFVDGVLQAETESNTYNSTDPNWTGNLSCQWRGQLSESPHTVTIRVWTNDGTLTAVGIKHNMIIREIDEG